MEQAVLLATEIPIYGKLKQKSPETLYNDSCGRRDDCQDDYMVSTNDKPLWLLDFIDNYI